MRTWLFVPGHEEHKARKALDAPASHVIFDWEDAVPEANREEARQTTRRLLEPLSPAELQRIVVRVNHPSSAFFVDDAKALQGLVVGFVMIPKVESPEEVHAAAELDTSLVLIIESARGVAHAHALVAAHTRVRYVAFGPLDLLADLGGQWSSEGLETMFARSKIVVAARAARLDGALDGPYPDLQDDEGLRRDTELGRRMGYAGRMVIHPRQLAIVEAAYAPTDKDLEFARKVLEAVAKGVREGHAALQVDGRFIDPPVVKWAQQVVTRADDS